MAIACSRTEGAPDGLDRALQSMGVSRTGSEKWRTERMRAYPVACSTRMGFVRSGLRFGSFHKVDDGVIAPSAFAFLVAVAFPLNVESRRVVLQVSPLSLAFCVIRTRSARASKSNSITNDTDFKLGEMSIETSSSSSNIPFLSFLSEKP